MTISKYGLHVGSLMTVGVFAGLLLSESLGDAAGWTVGMATAWLLADASIWAHRVTDRSIGAWILAAIWILTLGLGAGRVTHGLHEAQAERDSRVQSARAALDACVQDARTTRAQKAKGYRGNAPTAMGKRWDKAEKQDIAACREETTVPAATAVGLADLTWAEWFTILAPVVFELGASILVKFRGAVIGRRRNDEEDAAQAEVDAAKAKADAEADARAKIAEAQAAVDARVAAVRGEYAVKLAKLEGEVKVTKAKAKLQPPPSPKPAKKRKPADKAPLAKVIPMRGGLGPQGRAAMLRTVQLG